MSLCYFFSNLKYLCRKKLKKEFKDYSNFIIEEILYEIPTSGIKRPKIKNYEETLDILLNSDCSIARFGDGEVDIINGNNIPYQQYDKELAKRLKEILQIDDEKCLTAINFQYYYPTIEKLIPFVQTFYRNKVPSFRKELSKLINYDKQYYDAAISGLYMTYNDFDFENYYNKLKKIWHNKKILIVGCENAIKSVKYNIYDNAKEINYLYVPAKNSFSQYKEVYQSVKSYSNNTLIILMAGPLSKVLAFDLSRNNNHQPFRALDLGHLIKDYDYYKNNIPHSSEQFFNFFGPDDKK